MIKYAQIVDDESKLCNVGTGDNADFYKSIGMTEVDVEQAYDGRWYLSGYAPKEKPTEEKIAMLDAQYNVDKAELVAQYTDSLMHDDEATAEAIKQEMAELDAQYDADYEAIINEETEEE